MDKELFKKVAVGYVGTPHINGGKIKQGGIDCAQLPAQIFTEMGLGAFETPKGYSAIWFTRKDAPELILPYLERYCYQIERKDLQVGDIIAYQWGRAVSHLALMIDEERQWVIHSNADNGVEIVEIDAPCFLMKNGRSREHSYWRLREVLE